MDNQPSIIISSSTDDEGENTPGMNDQPNNTTSLNDPQNINCGESQHWSRLVKRIAIGWLRKTKRHLSTGRSEVVSSEVVSSPVERSERSEFSRLAPDSAAVLLRQPTVSLYGALARQVRGSQDAGWLRQFLLHHGLEILFDTLEATSNQYYYQNFTSGRTVRKPDRKTSIFQYSLDVKDSGGGGDSTSLTEGVGTHNLLTLNPNNVINNNSSRRSSFCENNSERKESFCLKPDSSGSKPDSSSLKSDSLFGVLLQLGCVECISLVMDSKESLDYIIETEEFIQRFSTGELQATTHLNLLLYWIAIRDFRFGSKVGQIGPK